MAGQSASLWPGLGLTTVSLRNLPIGSILKARPPEMRRDHSESLLLDLRNHCYEKGHGIDVISNSEIGILKIPNSVTMRLEELNLPYQTEKLDEELLASRIQRANTDTTQLARCFYLKVGDQIVKFVGSVNALCNLDAISDRLEEKAYPLTVEEELQINQREDCETIHAIPVRNAPLPLVDEGILSTEKIYLPSGVKGLFFALEGSSLAKLYSDCPTVSADTRLPVLDEYEAGRPQQDITDIQNAIRSYTSLKIKKELSDTLSIPPLPTTAQQILDLRSNPSADVEDLAKIVQLDPALAAQVVGWASSPYYSAPGNINSIHDAIVRVLGFQLVMNLSLGLAIGKTLSYPERCPYGIKSFWQQSIYCAITMEKLNRAMDKEQRGSAGLCYLTGLLNNFGYLITAHVFPDYFQQICQLQMANRHLLYCYIELHLLGICRDQISSHLLQAWKLPAEVSSALRFQHSPDYTGHHHNYANLCLVAKRLLKAKGIGQIPTSTIPVHLYERLGLTPDTVEQTIDEVFQCSEEIEQMTNLFTRTG